MKITIADYTFEGPFLKLSELRPLRGVFAVVCLTEKGVSLLIDVDQAENIQDAVRNHERKDCWKNNATGIIGVAALYTPDLDPAGRRDIVEIIRRREFAPCG
ncbi:MAG: hypothetical protein D6726_09010 [Nitrospirae bacterium]|nr:MAG: hypothetical protein D6726_09010 [Nitrospirota bacterium]